MEQFINGFQFGFGFFWGLSAWAGCLMAVALLFAVIMGGLADRYQKVNED